MKKTHFIAILVMIVLAALLLYGLLRPDSTKHGASTSTLVAQTDPRTVQPKTAEPSIEPTARSDVTVSTSPAVAITALPPSQVVALVPATPTSFVPEATNQLQSRIVDFNVASGILVGDDSTSRRTRLAPFCEPAFLNGLSFDTGQSNADKSLAGATIVVKLTTADVYGNVNSQAGTASMTARVTVSKEVAGKEVSSVTYNRKSFWRLDKGVWLVEASDGI